MDFRIYPIVHTTLILFLLLLTLPAQSQEVTSDTTAVCSLPELTQPESKITFEEIFSELRFNQLVQYIPPTDANAAHYAVEHPGLVYRIVEGKKSLFLDITARVHHGEQWGLHQVALHPDFPHDPRIFLTYVGYGPNHTKKAPTYQSRVSVFLSDSKGTYVPAESEVILLNGIERDQAWHPIGGLLFGPDRFLYIGWGEGNRLLLRKEAYNGKILRIDVGSAGTTSYSIPEDNPLKDTPVPESYAEGLRNPWRFSFAPNSNKIYVGDVGDRSFEEVNLVEAGRHYGWPHHEGTSCLLPDKCRSENTPPLLALSRDRFCAVIGGYMYQGKTIPELHGQYIFADYCSRTVWALTPDQQPNIIPQQIGQLELPRSFITSFAEDNSGALYITVYDNNEQGTPEQNIIRSRLYKIVPVKSAAASVTVKDSDIQELKKTGCFPNGYSRVPHGFLAYQIVQPPFDNGAKVFRSILSTAPITIYGNTDFLGFPQHVPIAFIKNFEINGIPIETQIIHRKPFASWQFLDYEWDEAGQSAKLVFDSRIKKLKNGQQWLFPGSNGCQSCHSESANLILGFRMSQLNYRLQSESGIYISQIETLIQNKLFQDRPHLKLASPLAALERGPYSHQTLARSYLEANCAHCHEPRGSSSFLGMDLRAQTPLEDMGICRKLAASMPGKTSARYRVNPGKPEESVLSLRLREQSSHAMPPGRTEIDHNGLASIDAWIESLAQCP